MKKYSAAEKQRALDTLQQYSSMRAAARALDIPFYTLKEWRKQARVQQAEQELKTLHALRRRLAESALRLAESLDEMIEGAPLNQRASALGLIFDRYFKLDQHLSAREKQQQQSQVIRIEYLYPDGTIHPSPPWAEDDHQHEGTVSGGGVWSPFWEDRSGENSHQRVRGAGDEVLVARADVWDERPSMARLEDELETHLWDEP